MAGGGSKQQSSTSSATSIVDQRVGVADDGIYAGAGASVVEGNDFRTFDDHSSFELTSVTTDSRDFSDNSQFHYTDSSQTYVTTADPEVAKAAIAASEAAATAAAAAADRASTAAEKTATAGLSAAVELSRQSTGLFESALGFGEAATSEAFRTANVLTEAGFGAVADANERSLDFARDTQAGAVSLIGDVIGRAFSAVTQSADADRAFASEFTGRIFETTKSADQQNVEKIVKAVTVVLGLIVAAWAGVRIFGKARV